MNGHPTPRRMATRLGMSRRGWPPAPALLLLIFFLVATLSLLLAGCATQESETTPTTAADVTSVAETSSTSVPSTGSTDAQFPVTVTDDLGNTVTIPAKPLRIVSTAPANTEILFALGAGDRVVGVNALDDYPPEVADITKIGDFQVNTEAVMALSPDLVVAYSGNEEALVQIEKAGCPVLIFDPKNLEQIYTDISVVGTATGTGDEADQLVASIRATIEEITTSASLSGYKPTVFYAVDNTLWSAGSETFVDELLTLVNAVNVAATAGDGGTAISGYFQFAPEQLVAADPDIVLLPAGFYASIDEFVSDPRFAGLTAVKEGRVRLVNDVIITRPGPRIGEGLRELAKALRPEAF